MNVRKNGLVSPKLIKVLAAVVIGLSVGAVLPPNPAAIDAIGTIPGVLVSGAGVIGGAIIYVKAPDLVGAKSCGCTGECGCSN